MVNRRTAAPAEEAAYTRNELIAGAASFSVTPEIVAGALKLAGKDTLTRAEAEVAIQKFCGRKV